MKRTLPTLSQLFLALALTTLTAWAKDGWLTDFAAAQKLATETKKPILIDFTGSDWCGWCIKIDQETLSQAAFKKYAADHLVLFEADFPRSKAQKAELKKQNDRLQTKYDVSGFPTFVLLTPEGKTLGKIEGYLKGGPSAFMAKLDEFRAKTAASK